MKTCGYPECKLAVTTVGSNYCDGHIALATCLAIQKLTDTLNTLAANSTRAADTFSKVGEAIQELCTATEAFVRGKDCATN